MQVVWTQAVSVHKDPLGKRESRSYERLVNMPMGPRALRSTAGAHTCVRHQEQDEQFVRIDTVNSRQVVGRISWLCTRTLAYIYL
jgi:hypothetical protein